MASPSSRFAGLAVLLVVVACSDSGKSGSESKRLWGRDRINEETEKRAKDKIDPNALEENEELRARVITMSFDEVVARLGFVEYSGVAKWDPLESTCRHASLSIL